MPVTATPMTSAAPAVAAEPLTHVPSHSAAVAATIAISTDSSTSGML
jgi:hypothetical protein